jgi:hypothetical protein
MSVNTKLSWVRLANGDQLSREHPIRLIKPISRHAGDPGWQITAPLERIAAGDALDAGDGYYWSRVTSYDAPHGVDFGNVQDAKRHAATNLDELLTKWVDEDYPSRDWQAIGHPAVVEAAERREAVWAAQRSDYESPASQVRAAPRKTSRAELLRLLDDLAGVVVAVDVDQLPDGVDIAELLDRVRLVNR